MGHTSCAFSSRVVLLLGLCAATAACESETVETKGDQESFEEQVGSASAEAKITLVDVSREEVSGDVAHYTVVLRIGDSAATEIAIHRVVSESAPWVAIEAASAIVLLHGDFATFSSNFLPPPVDGNGAGSHGLAGYLAGQGIDVWGVDRRWTRTPADTTDFSSYSTMGLAEELDDTSKALAFVRALRNLTGSGNDPVLLGGFSHGAQITYEYAGFETEKPAAQRHVKGIVPLDIYDRIAPEDEDLRLAACASRDAGLEALNSGALAVENGFFADMGALAEDDPDGANPYFDGNTNREALLILAGQTFLFYAPVPDYHLAGALISNEVATEFRYSPEVRIARWFGASPPYQSTLESADLDAIWCGEEPRPVPDHLADIQVPLFYIGVAGGFGQNGLYTTTIVGSSDVQTLVLEEQDPALRSEDLGHGDVLYGDKAPALAWDPLAAWIKSH